MEEAKAMKAWELLAAIWDRLLSRSAALGFFLLSIAAVLYFWRFL